MQLGNAGAVRNAAAAVAEQRASRARVTATVRRFNETVPPATSRRIAAS